LSSESFSLKGSFDESGEVDDFDWYESPTVYACGVSWFVGDIQFSAHAQRLDLARGSVWLLGSEGVGGYFFCAGGCGVEEGCFSGVRFPDYSNANHCGAFRNSFLLVILELIIA